MPATKLAPVDTREVVRCDHCLLVQFRTEKNACRKCHTSFEEEEKETSPLPIIPSKPRTVPAPRPKIGIVIRLGKLIGTLRTAHGLTVAEVSERTGIKPKTITRIEGGEIEVGFIQLEQLAEVLKTRGSSLVAQLENPGTSFAEPFIFRKKLFARHIGPTLRQIRKGTDNTQEGIGRMIGVPIAKISHLESNIDVPSLHFVARFAKLIRRSMSSVIAAIEDGAISESDSNPYSE